VFELQLSDHCRSQKHDPIRVSRIYRTTIMMTTKYHCPECDEDIEISNAAASRSVCLTCGAALSKVTANHSELASRTDNMSSLEGLFELLGADIRDVIQEVMEQSKPTRHISVDYLRTLGKVQVDRHKTILQDISLIVGPMQLLVIPAKFGMLASVMETTEGKVVCAEPICGECELRNDDACRGAITVLQRGLVTFPLKSVRAQNAGASAVVVTQTSDVFPFVMEDTSQELAATPVNIPVVMISKKDGEAVLKLVEERHRAGESVTATLKVGHAVTECSICQELFEEGNTVLKLPCRHVYHVDCVTHWLEQNHTCPLCRLELPKETQGKRLQARDNSARSADPSRNYYN
jgi:ribosomal protein L37AE/L43A